MFLAERHIVSKGKKQFKVLDMLCYKSKNLYNAALYHIRQEYFSSGRIIRYHELEKHFKEINQPDYRALPINTSQQILFILDKNVKSFLSLLIKWKKDPSSLPARPKFPKYKHKTKGRNVVVFTYGQVRLKNGLIYFAKKSGLAPLKTKQTNLKQVRLIPQASCYVIEVVYEGKPKEAIQTGNQASIDLGISNLAALTFSNQKETYLINGRPLKSINQYYNKQKAGLQAALKKRHDRYESHKTRRLTQKRNYKINDYLHKSSKIIVEKLKENQVSQLVIGYNKGWKQGINLGRKAFGDEFTSGFLTNRGYGYYPVRVNPHKYKSVVKTGI